MFHGPYPLVENSELLDSAGMLLKTLFLLHGSESEGQTLRNGFQGIEEAE